MISSKTFVLVYAGSGEAAALNRHIAKDIIVAGGQAHVVRQKETIDSFHLSPAPQAALPILEILPAQMVSLALAKIQGFEAGRFERISKVTTKE